MFTLRCTQKLLRRLPEFPNPEPATPTTVLGDWYANVVMLGRRPFVLAVSERTFLAAIVPLKEARTLRARLREQIGEVLIRLGVPQNAFESEMAEMETSVLGKTASRRVVGVLVDFAHLMQAAPDKAVAPVSFSLWVSRTPCGPLDGFPDLETARLLGREANVRLN